jgi:hypothetical protein
LVFSKKLAAYKPGGKRLLFKVSDLEKYAYSNGVGNHSDRADKILNAAQRKKPRRKAKAGARYEQHEPSSAGTES